MKQLYTLLTVAVVLGLSSCSSSKNAAQTDDGYYSSGASKRSSAAQGDYVASSPNDQYVQMRVQDPERWSYFDNYSAYDSYYAPAPMMGMGYGMGYPYPAYGFGCGYGMGYGASFGLGFGDPYMMWNTYFIWNSWYNPYFYNPYYGGGALVVNHSATSIYSNLRPFNTTAYASGIAHYNASGNSRNTVYRPGMTSTSVYNTGLRTTSTGRMVNNFNHPTNNTNNVRSFSQPTRSYSPSVGGGGGFRGGGGGFHH
jgi:hypothetical protein